jgi:hypothetical protein
MFDLTIKGPTSSILRLKSYQSAFDPRHPRTILQSRVFTSWELVIHKSLCLETRLLSHLLSDAKTRPIKCSSRSQGDTG